MNVRRGIPVGSGMAHEGNLQFQSSRCLYLFSDTILLNSP